MTKSKKPTVIARGIKAVEMANAGAPLHVQSLSGEYLPAFPGTLGRIARLGESDMHSLWIYVVLK